MYFRFDPPTDFNSIGLDEWEKLNDIAELAHAYVHEAYSTFCDCIAAITYPVSSW
jgi:hypothetical protein